ncbi:ras guanine nucleotide exchange factor domain-containing protein [Entophlyctis helioformis]|nr:ras guanine nucleotide exchange factor domain-containing protein [Entophlyctis helioformis]
MRLAVFSLGILINQSAKRCRERQRTKAMPTPSAAPNTAPLDPQACIFNSLFYRAGTQIPFSLRFGTTAVLYNHATGAIAPLDAQGTARLEAGGVYTIEESDSSVLRLSRVPDSYTQSRRNSDMPSSGGDKSFFRFTLGRSSNRRRSDTVLASANNRKAQTAAKNAGIMPLKIPIETSEEAQSDQRKRNISASKSATVPMSSMLSPDGTGSEPLTPMSAGFFTMRRKTKKGDDGQESASSAATSIAELSKSNTSVMARRASMADRLDEEAPSSPTAMRSDGEEMDLLDFLRGPPKHNRQSSIDGTAGELAGMSGLTLSQSSSTTNPAGIVGSGSFASAIGSDATDKRQSFHSVASSSGHSGHQNISTSTSSSAHPSMRIKAGSQLQSILAGGADSESPTPTGSEPPPPGASAGFYSTLSRGNSVNDMGNMSVGKTAGKRMATGFQMSDAESPVQEGFLRTEDGNLFFRIADYALRAYKETDTASQRPIFEIHLGGCTAMPLRTTTDDAFEIMHPPGGRLRCTAPSYAMMIAWVSTINTASSNITLEHGVISSRLEDLQQSIYRKEYHSLLTALRDETGLSDAAAIACSADALADDVPHSPMRQNSMDDLGVAKIQYQPDSDGLQTPFHVTQATLDKLVERLTDQYGPDRAFIKTILHTYRHVTDSATFLQKLTARLHVSLASLPPSATSTSISTGGSQTNSMVGSAESLTPEAANNWRPIIKLRTIAVVLTWIRVVWAPDFTNPAARACLDQFIAAIQGSFGPDARDKVLDAAHADEFKILSGHFREAVKRRESRYNAVVAALPSESPVASNPASPEKTKAEFLDLDPIEVARYLTRREHEMLCAIKPIHFLLRLWCDEKDPVIAREIRPINDMVDSFNHVSFWVATEVCTQPEQRNRARVIESYIRIAKECRKLNNYGTLMAIVSGLNLVAVSRLKATWETVDARRVKQLGEMEGLLSPMSNFRTYRALLDELEEEAYKTRALAGGVGGAGGVSGAGGAGGAGGATPKPYVPILSLFLKDLLFMNDGNPKMTESGCINVDKLRTLYGRILQLLMAQETGYGQLSGVGSGGAAMASTVAVYCSTMRSLKEQALYKYSCLCEPKQGDTDSLRLREKWMQQS